MFLVCFTQLTDLIDIKSLIWIHFEHSNNKRAQHLAVSLWWWWKTTFGYPLKELIQVEIFLVARSKRTSKCTKFIPNAPHAPNIWFPIVTFALQDFGAHVERCSNSWKSLECLRAQLSTQSKISNFKITFIINEDVCRFKVTMHNPFLVHVLQCACYLVNVFPYLLLWKWNLVFLRTFHYKLEIAFLGPFHSNKKLVKLIINKPV